MAESGGAKETEAIWMFLFLHVVEVLRRGYQ